MMDQLPPPKPPSRSQFIARRDAFAGQTTLAAASATVESLVSWDRTIRFRGVFLLTGTGIVPPMNSPSRGDWSISITGVGTLTNTVMQGE